ncbi:MAG: tRNA (N6-isopentenyl adenosine(37)-C2)-methylthiotransferase MiaB [Nitrospirota bacterium]|nr:MAG: tRNA (N6-isopentenyl adenosine(37)-C2)-methylthiotransferase MiaB [Nitrospirota bacterium]
MSQSLTDLPLVTVQKTEKKSQESYRVYIETFGCQMNEYDTELVRSLLKSRGFGFTDHGEQADVVLLNTCAIRENAHNRVYAHLADYKALRSQRGLVIGVLGCMAQNLKKDLFDSQSMIDVLVGPDAYRRLPDLLLQAIEARTRGLAVDLSEYETYEEILPVRGGGVNAWIAVMRGCDNFCTFCVVPYTRGRERSRNPQGILIEAQQLAEQGYKQITLLGQNVNSYRYQDWDFAKLLLSVAEVPGIERVRFTSPHPKDFPPALLDAVAEHPKVCNHIHLPAQSGNDRILQLMGRCYSRKEYLELVEAIRRRGDIALSTDIICGFCSETEEEYQDTIRLMQEVEFQSAFIFKYSERKNTIAGRKHPDDVPESIKSERVGRLIEWQRDVSARKNQALIGQSVKVLVEGDAKKSKNQWMGHTESNTTVVWNKADRLVKPGDLVSITVEDGSASTLYGSPTSS